MWVEVGGLGERVVGQPRGRQSGCRFEVGGTEIKRVLMVMMMMEARGHVLEFMLV